MTRTNSVTQRTVVDWFESTYRKRGARYLRPRAAYLIFPELLRARNTHRWLDVACGLGMLLDAARGYTPHLHGIDISAVAVEQARKNVAEADLLRGNAEQLPYADGTFDLITCLGSLERMLDTARALREMQRVGRVDARYCFLVRNSDTFSWKYGAALSGRQRALGHAGANSLDGWWRLFESHGFRITDALPDQYPLHRRERWRSLWTKRVDYRKPSCARKPLEDANEFIFLLEKRS